MAIKDALEVIDQMQADGVIGRYAIGGAMGALLYIEAASTEDVDVFVDLPVTETGTLVDLSPVYEYLTSRGCTTRGEYIMIEDWQVQFLPASTPLLQEALSQAVEVAVEGTKTDESGALGCHRHPNRSNEGPRARVAIHRTECS